MTVANNIITDMTARQVIHLHHNLEDRTCLNFKTGPFIQLSMCALYRVFQKVCCKKKRNEQNQKGFSCN